MSTNICEKIETDGFFQQFLQPLNADVASKIAISYSDQISKLTEGLETLSVELQSQVRDQYGALLSQAHHAGRLENAIDIVNDHVQSIQKSADRIKGQITVPYNVLKTQIEVLERLHDVSHILRQTGRFQQLYKKLQSTKELTEQASIIFELEPLLSDKDLESIEFIKDEMANTISIRQKLLSVSSIDLSNGLKDKNEVKINNGLQILSNLHKLSSALDEWLAIFINDIKISIKECFSGTDIATINQQKASQTTSSTKQTPRGPGKLPTLTSSQNFRQKLWGAIDWLFNDEIYSVCLQVILLQKCVENLHIHEFNENKMCVKNKFWDDLEKLLEISFRDCPGHITQCLQQSLPKLLAAARGLQAKLGNNLAFGPNTFKSLEAGYLEKCGTTLKASFSGSDYPSQDAVDLLIRTTSIEFSAALVDENLSILVTSVFSAVNKDFWNKIEAYIKLGTDSEQVLDLPNASQLQNISLANTIYYHNSQVKRMVTNLGNDFSNSKAAKKILEDLKNGDTLVLTILQQLVESMNSALNIILLSMHREPGLNSSNTSNLSCSGSSLYMKEFQDFLQRAWTSHITPFDDFENVRQCGKELAKRCIESFIQNLSVLRPISKAGRHRLKSDCLHFETAIKPICKDLSALGKQYRMLRAVSGLIILTPDKIIEQTSELDGPIPSYIILFMLFAYAGNDLSSPHIAAGWSNEKLLQWLNGHTSDRERLELIAGAIQKYRTIIRQKNISQYDDVYPLISSYLEKALAVL